MSTTEPEVKIKREVVFLQLTSATQPGKVYYVADAICAMTYSLAHKATLVMINGGGMIPVKESPEEIMTMLKEALENGNG